MGLTKEYSRVSPSGKSFGLIASPDSCIRFVTINNISDRFVATSGCLHINIWDLKTHQLCYTIGSSSSGISYFDVILNGDPLIAVGHSNGSIEVYDYVSQELKCTLNGHKNGITCLSFDPKEMRLVSGGKDSTIVVWDLVSESGLFRLKGHKNSITQCRFMKNFDYLISSSKDGMIKFWDLKSQHCFKTFIAHRNQVLDFVLYDNDKRLITGSDELKVWKISLKTEKENHSVSEEPNSDDEVEDNDDAEDETCIFSVKFYGTILRESASHFKGFCLDSSERLLLCRGKDSTVECLKIRNEEEIKTRLQKRARKERKQGKRSADSQSQNNDDQTFIEDTPLTLKDEIERLKGFQTSYKVRFCAAFCQKNTCKIALVLLSNCIELYHMNLIGQETSKVSSLETEGHRSDIKTIAFSSDNLHILTASTESLKIWSRNNRCCVSTMSEDYETALCSAFIYSDRYCVTGTKTGKIQIFDIGSASVHQTIEASDQGLSIRSLCLNPDGKGLVTGSEDKTVKFWELEFVKFKQTIDSSQLTLAHTRSLVLDEEVLCVKMSPNGKFLAVSLLDCSVKIFYVDSLKFFLTLYGHKLPVRAMDISHDNRIIATGSGDKNMKIWGLDFGDCHRSIFAHDLDITSVHFVPKSHLIFTTSNDKTIKQWDADNFEKITVLKEHQGEVLCAAISPNGKYLASASHDKTLRIWEETEEPLILEEEREIEREEEMYQENDMFDNHVIPGESNQESSLATKSTKETIIATERLIEAIDIFKETMKAKINHQRLSEAANEQGMPTPPQPTLHPMMIALQTECPHRFMLKTVLRIKSNEIQEALISLPFNYVIDFLKILSELLERHWERETVIRFICFLIRIHFGQITSSPSLVPTIDKLRSIIKPVVEELKDLFGFNLSAVEYLQSELEAREEVKLFLEVFSRHEKSKNKKKKAKKIVENAPILSLK